MNDTVKICLVPVGLHGEKQTHKYISIQVKIFPFKQRIYFLHGKYVLVGYLHIIQQARIMINECMAAQVFIEILKYFGSLNIHQAMNLGFSMLTQCF